MSQSKFFLFAVLAAAILPIGVPRSVRASEQNDLMSCYGSIQYDSDGPGDDLGRWEMWSGDSHNPHLRPTIAVPGKNGTKDGLFIYTEENAYFIAEPQDRDTQLFGYHFDLRIPDRYPFQCELSSSAQSWDDLKKKIYRKGTHCRLFEEPGTPYKRVSPRAFSGPAPVHPLRSAAALRIFSMPLRFQKEVDRYSKALEDYRAASRTSVGNSLRNLLGWTTRPPLPPSPDSLIRKLEACTRIEDEFVRSNARSAIESLRRIPIPQDCGCGQ